MYDPYDPYDPYDNGDGGGGGNGLAIVLVMTLAIALVAIHNNGLNNSYRGDTPEAECARQSGPNDGLYRQCLKAVEPVFTCKRQEPGNLDCWSREGTTNGQ